MTPILKLKKSLNLQQQERSFSHYPPINSIKMVNIDVATSKNYQSFVLFIP